MTYKFINTNSTDTEFTFEDKHFDYIPIGSNQFVSAYLFKFYLKLVTPRNIPLELLPLKYTKRFVFNGTENEIVGKKFIKSNTEIKKYTAIVDDDIKVQTDEYQISDIIDIQSEWRAFVYMGKLVGLQNYAGDFTMFPSVMEIEKMIDDFTSAPMAYTLDVGINDEEGTFVIECHSFFSCGLYGMADHAILPFMFAKAFNEIVNTK